MIALAALAVALSLGPYHGPPLNGSVPGTAKFGLAVRGAPYASVRLRASGVPPGWIASFCTDRVCAPFRVTLTLPQSGTQLIEFQLIQNEGGARAPRTITVSSSDGTRATAAFGAATH